MVDGLFLPCVVFKNRERQLKQAIKRFDEERKGKGIFHKSINGYQEIVKTFVTSGNRLDDYNIQGIEPSKYAFPKDILSKIEGETRMSWTGFVVKMRDGKRFAFGSTFNWEFFDLPNGYSPGDIEEVINHSYLDEEGELKSYYSNESVDFKKLKIFRERPFFTCYVDGL